MAIMLHNMNKVRMHSVTDRFGLETVEFDPSRYKESSSSIAALLVGSQWKQ